MLADKSYLGQPIELLTLNKAVAKLKFGCLADVEQLSTLQGLRNLNLSHLESIKRGMLGWRPLHEVYFVPTSAPQSGRGMQQGQAPPSPPHGLLHY